ncbi:MAG: hypothetical protein JXA01_02125, partial [Dehalococcoidia bacterium]|nr:hypothetical protein [Dehalococcoidia bacterium]
MLILAVGSGLSGTWALISNEPLIPVISESISSIPEWQKWLLIIISLLIVAFALIVLIIILKRNTKTTQIIKEKAYLNTNTINTTIPSRSEAVEKSKIVWAFLFTG